MKNKISFSARFFLLSAVLAGAAASGIFFGAEKIPAKKILAVLFAPESKTADAPYERIIIRGLRAPRCAAVVLTGALLGMAGALFQGLFRNPLADPYCLGVSSGASFGAALAIVAQSSFFFERAVSARAVVPAAFCGALLAASVVCVIAETRGGDLPIISLLLSGSAISALFSALVLFLMSAHDQEMQKIFFWTAGSFNTLNERRNGVLLICLLITTLCAFTLARPLDMLNGGEGDARAMGVSIKTVRRLTIAAASLASAAAVSVAGVIGFVGLVAPHIARIFFGSSHLKLIPAAAMIGACILSAADLAARTAAAPAEIPVGIFTALLGAPFFLYLLTAKKNVYGNTRHE